MSTTSDYKMEKSELEVSINLNQTNDVPVEDNDFQKKLFEIPDELEFPLEMSFHLKGKLHSVLEQNWHLKRHLDYLDKEVIDLRKYRADHREKCGRPPEPDFSNASTSMMTQRIVELSKKNRDLTAQTEGMKTKINKLLRANESLKNMVECFRDKDSSENLITQTASNDLGNTTPGSQHSAQLTNKVIEYRRQNQLLRMELRTALRALCQEVGDGVTPHNVLNTVNGSVAVASWRGRQQQILALQQKVSELQVKLKDSSINNCEQEQAVFQQTNGAGDADLNMIAEKVDKNSNVSSCSNIPQRVALIQQERKKQEQMDKLTQDLEQTTRDWKNCQQDLKASKARIQTLEGLVKTYKRQIESLEITLNEGEKVTDSHNKEMKKMRQEVANLSERERRYRDQTALEIQDCQRALQRERAIVVRLQGVVQDKQDMIQLQDADIIELRNKLKISCSGTFAGGMSTVDRVREMELQLQNAAKAIDAGDHERQSLLKMMHQYLNQAEEERQKAIQTSEHTARISCVLKRADQCINECLDAGQVTNDDVLQEVEHIKTLIRELKLGDLYVYENVQHKDMAKKFKTQVEMLKREVASLKASLKEQSTARKNDLQNFASATEKLKKDWEDIVNIKHTAASLISHAP